MRIKFNKNISISVCILLLLIPVNLFSQSFINPSFEGMQGRDITPEPWQNCDVTSSVDTQPGAFEITLPPSHLNTYIGMVCRDDGTYESITQTLSSPLVENACYEFSIDLATAPGDLGTYSPAQIVFWGGNSFCDKKEILWTSPLITNENWQTYNVPFSPSDSYSNVGFDIIYSSLPAYFGYILIDNLSQINESPFVDIQNERLLCPNETLTIDATLPGATYLWQDNSTNSIFNVSEVGTYSVEITLDACKLTEIVDVNLGVIPSIELGNDTILCEGDILTLDATTAHANYIWQDNSTNPTYNVTQEGTYSVSCSTVCGVNSDVINVNFKPNPPIDFGNEITLCEGETLELNATTLNATYLWQDNSINSIFNVTHEGEYWVEIYVNNCSFTENVNVEFNTKPSIELGNDTALCDGQVLKLDATNLNATYLWQDDTSNSTFDVVEAGKYWVYCANSCGSTTDVINVSYNPNPIIDIGTDTTLCEGESLILDVTTMNATYIWQDNSSNSTFSVSEEGNYWVDMTVNNCSVLEGINVAFVHKPTVDLGKDTTLCQGDSITLDATTQNSSFLWQNGLTSQTIEVKEQGAYWVQVSNTCGSAVDTIKVDIMTYKPTVSLGNDTILCSDETLILDASLENATYLWQDNSLSTTYNVAQQGSYWVKVTVNNCSETDTINVTFNSIPPIDLGNNRTLCNGETLTLDASSSAIDPTYLWQDDSTLPKIDVTQLGEYWVEVTVGNCVLTETILIDEKGCASVLLLPNIFTPNKDGINDLFIPITYSGILSMHTTIYDRWGSKVYETNNTMIEWDGENVNSGTYFWIINYTDVNNLEGIKRGHLSVFK